MRRWFVGQGTRRGREGRGGRDDGLEGVDRKSIEEFMGENEWRFGGICRERLRLVKTSGKGGGLWSGSPLGTKRMSSHHVIGSPEYLLVLRRPISISSKGASPHRSFL